MPQNLSTLLSIGLELTELNRPEIWVRTAQSWTRVTRNNFLRLIVIRTGISCEEYESLSPPPRSSVRVACARTQVTFGPTTPAPAPVDRPMDTG